MEEEYYIGQIFKGEYPQGAADFCNETQTAMITEIEPIIVEDEQVRRFQIVEVPLPPAPTEEEQRQKRAEAYRLEKDPITCQITSLRDEEQTPEVVEEINELLQKRAEVVEEIKERYPYPVGGQE